MSKVPINLYVYIAGPLNGSGRVADNIRNAVRVGVQLRQYFDNVFPIVPHLFWFAEYQGFAPKGDDFWLKWDIGLLQTCNAMLRLPGRSPGSMVEEAAAREHAVPVFHNFNSLVMWLEDEGGERRVEAVPLVTDEERAEEPFADEEGAQAGLEPDLDPAVRDLETLQQYKEMQKGEDPIARARREDAELQALAQMKELREELARLGKELEKTIGERSAEQAARLEAKAEGLPVGMAAIKPPKRSMVYVDIEEEAKRIVPGVRVGPLTIRNPDFTVAAFIERAMRDDAAAIRLRALAPDIALMKKLIKVTGEVICVDKPSLLGTRENDEMAVVQFYAEGRHLVAEHRELTAALRHAFSRAMKDVPNAQARLDAEEKEEG